MVNLHGKGLKHGMYEPKIFFFFSFWQIKLFRMMYKKTLFISVSFSPPPPHPRSDFISIMEAFRTSYARTARPPNSLSGTISKLHSEVLVFVHSPKDTRTCLLSHQDNAIKLLDHHFSATRPKNWYLSYCCVCTTS